MRMTIKKYGLAVLICAVVCLSFIPLSFGEGKIPKPGTVIDKSNYMEYKHLFPEEHLPLFTDMFGLGLEPLSITVGESTQPEIIKAVRKNDENNRGKYQLDAEGYVNAPTETIVGQPFFGVDTSDQNFAQKFMWNFYYRYQYDTSEEGYFTQFTKRRNESRVGVDIIGGYSMYYTARFVRDPIPYLPNTNNLRNSMMIKLAYPPVNKNLINLMWSHLDPRMEDTGYVYVPAFRRVLRTESSERSTPSSNSTQAPDDFNIFMGRIPEFNFKFVGEQTVLAVPHTHLKGLPIKEALKYNTFPFDKEGWEPRKVVVIDITPKNPAYPQSLKRIYVDPEGMLAYYGIAWDRAGAIWKVWTNSFRAQPMPDKERLHSTMFTMWGADIPMGYTTFMLRSEIVQYNHRDYAEGDFTPSSVRGLAN